MMKRRRPRSATVLAGSTSSTATTAINNNHHQPGRGGGGLLGFASSSGRGGALRAGARTPAGQTGGTATTTPAAIGATDLSRTKKSLENTLQANRRLQHHVLQELQRIAQCKRENRIQTEAAIRRLSDRPSDKDDDSLPSWMQPDSKIRPKDLNALFVSSSETETATATTTSDTNGTDTSNLKSRDREQIKPKRKWNTSKVRQFRFDPYRKWSMEYFVDPTGSRPRPNDDLTLRHQTMYGGSGGATEEGGGPYFFHHTQQPFTNKEKSHLKRLLSNPTTTTTTTTGSNVGNDTESPDDFYKQVAYDLNQEYHALTTPTKKQKADKMMLPTNRPRTARDVRLYHQHQVASHYQFSEQESQAIIDMVSTHGQSGRRPDWKDIADMLLVMLQDNANADSASSTLSTSSATSHPTASPPLPITAYQCMVHYKTKLAPMLAVTSTPSSAPSSSSIVVNNASSFSPQEDEFLLRYVAAMGPQFVWDMHQISDVAGRLLGPKPNQLSSSSSSPLPTSMLGGGGGSKGSGSDCGGKTPKRIHDHTTASLWNPLVKDSYWELEEERKLVLAMKVYHELDCGASGRDEKNDDDMQIAAGEANDDCHDAPTNKEPPETSHSLSAIRRAAQHFYPQRQPDKVAKKWERSLRPAPIQESVVDSIDDAMIGQTLEEHTKAGNTEEIGESRPVY